MKLKRRLLGNILTECLTLTECFNTNKTVFFECHVGVFEPPHFLTHRNKLHINNFFLHLLLQIINLSFKKVLMFHYELFNLLLQIATLLLQIINILFQINILQ